MADQISIGLRIPTHLAEPLSEPSRQLAEFARIAEALGFDSLWVTDRLFHRVGVLDPFVALSWAAAHTSRIRLGTSVFLLTLRDPVSPAKAAATLDYLSQGRLTFGVSIGGTPAEYRALGVQASERVARLRESLVVLRRLWSDDNTSFHGRFFEFEDASINPKPVQQPSIPIWLGGGSEAVLRRAAELADGWVAGAAGTPQEFAAAVSKLQEVAKNRGRERSSLDVGRLVYISVDPDRARGLELAGRMFDPYYGSGFAARSVVAGSVAECAEAVRPFAEVDAARMTVILGPPTFDPEQVQRLAEVAARLRRS